MGILMFCFFLGQYCPILKLSTFVEHEMLIEMLIECQVTYFCSYKEHSLVEYFKSGSDVLGAPVGSAYKKVFWLLIGLVISIQQFFI